jgi:hypothetical protein
MDVNVNNNLAFVEACPPLAVLPQFRLYRSIDRKMHLNQIEAIHNEKKST